MLNEKVVNSQQQISVDMKNSGYIKTIFYNILLSVFFKIVLFNLLLFSVVFFYHKKREKSNCILMLYVSDV